MMIIAENIEMELFSSEESCVVIQKQEENEQLGKYNFNHVSLNLQNCPKCINQYDYLVKKLISGNPSTSQNTRFRGFCHFCF